MVRIDQTIIKIAITNAIMNVITNAVTIVTSPERREMIEKQETVIMQENQDKEEITRALVIDQIAAIIKALIRVTIIIKMVTGALKITNAVREEMKDILEKMLKRYQHDEQNG